jgi:hypothetical protein
VTDSTERIRAELRDRAAKFLRVTARPDGHVAVTLESVAEFTEGERRAATEAALESAAQRLDDIEDGALRWYPPNPPRDHRNRNSGRRFVL